MKKIGWLKIYKIGLVILLAITVIGFFYFEPLATLRAIVVIMAIFSLWQLTKSSEIIVLLILYLGLNDLSNLHYLVGVPMSLSMVAAFALTYFLFLSLVNLLGTQNILEKKFFQLYAWTISLSILEFYVVMDFLPIDPRSKALIITVLFYLLAKLFYLNVHSVLNFKKVVGYVISIILIFGFVYLVNLRLGF